MSTLTGRVAVVTGAGKGIGAAIAASLAQEGAAVAISYATDAEAAGSVVSAIKQSGGQAIAVQADVRNTGDVKALFEAAREAFGPVTILVNNAAVAAFAPFETFGEEQFRAVFETNVLGAFHTIQEFGSVPEADGGAVVNITTAGVSSTPSYASLYVASKSALATATRVIAKELAPRGIRVNAIAPTYSDTESSRAMGFVGSDAAAQVTAQIPLGRLGKPEDIGPVAAFLASPAAGFITGEVIYATGGDR
jgi:3-oxoacyl-[acyl-carrier protein] reductase